ncbi:MAG: TIR domain-containing protein [Capsulimonadaceae bacterium]|nr:TIR domain-containing protein [Capsulimonadaceae bacterium]
MKVFVSYSRKDLATVERLLAALDAAGIETAREADRGQWGENLIERINQGVDGADYVIVVLSPSYLESAWSQQELATWRLKEVGSDRPFILPVLIDAIDMPSFLQGRDYFDLRGGAFGPALQALIDALQRGESPARLTRSRREPCSTLTGAHQLEKLREEFAKGNLSLFCGAGISISAGIPGWSVLLKHLISQLFSRVGEKTAIDTRSSVVDVYQHFFNLPPVVIAQYLKNGLGRDFKETVRRALYAGDPTSSPLIDAICELCRPQRERKSLSSIVTFNFDDLVEQNLGRNRIRYRSIYREGQRTVSSELPIYHVHGFLPREGALDETQDLVFSSDAYHTQFIDPFSWSNLTQLNHLSQNTCLFVGLSMTDPNLRRLLDVSMRKNPEKTLNHFVFRKRYDVDECAQAIAASGIQGRAEEHALRLVETAEILEEKDANALGLNLIWVNDFCEIGDVLHSLADDL